METNKSILNKLNINFTEENVKHFKIGIIGQVDNGKSFLFEQLTNQNIINKESGKITQTIYTHIGEELILFDTPGHEDFFHMRENVLPICDLIIIIASSLHPETLNKFIPKLNELNKDFIIFLSFGEKTNEQNILTKLTENNLLPTNLGGNYEIKIIKYSKFHYENFINIQTIQIEDVKNYLINYCQMLEKKTLIGEFGSFYVLNKIYNSKLSNIWIGLANHGNVINIKDNIIGTNDKIKKIFALDNVNFPIKKIIKFPKLFYFQTEFQTELQLGKEYLTHKTTNIEFIKNNINEHKDYQDKLLIVVVSSDEGRCIAINNVFKKKEKIAFLNFIGMPSELDLQFIKSKNGIMVYYNFVPNKVQLNLLKSINIEFYYHDEFYKNILYIENKLIDFESSENLKKLQEQNIAKAKIIKIFNFDNKIILGCKVLQGNFTTNNKAYIVDKYKIKSKLLFLSNIEIINKNVNMASKGEEVGISFENLQGEIANIGDILIFITDIDE